MGHANYLHALEIVTPERRGHGFTGEPFSCLDPALPPMVGFARTAKIRAAAPDLSPELPDRPARQLPDQPTTLWVDPPSTGVPRLRGALSPWASDEIMTPNRPSL